MNRLTNIYVTSPYPQNLIPLFESLKLALEAKSYKEHVDFEIIKSSNIAYGKCAVRFNIFKEHAQFVQYVPPHDHDVLSKSQAQLLVIDEAAAS